MRVAIPWQTDAQLTAWEALWDAVKDGSEFTYHYDDSYYKCGDGMVCGDGSTCGELTTPGATDRALTVKIENTSF